VKALDETSIETVQALSLVINLKQRVTARQPDLGGTTNASVSSFDAVFRVLVARAKHRAPKSSASA
jgi:hypothetical protein